MVLLPHQSKTPNLYLPGLAPDGHPRTHICLPGVWGNLQTEQLRGGHGEVVMPVLLLVVRQGYLKGRATVVVFDVINAETALVESRCITSNIITDLGAVASLGVFSHNSPVGANYLALDQSVAAVTLNGTITPGAQTALTVSATGASGYSGGAPSYQAANAASTFQANASNTGIKQNNNNAGVVSATVGLDTLYGTGITVSLGTSNAEGVAGSVTANSATNVNITSYVTTKTHTSGDWVVANGSTSDNPGSAPAGIQFSTAVTAVPSGFGIGGRSVVLTYTFVQGTITPGQYSGGWLTTAAASASGIWYGRFVLSPQAVSNNAGCSISYTIAG